MTRKNQILLFFSIFFMGIGCVKTDDQTFGSKDIQKIALPKETLYMMEGDTMNLSIIFNSRRTEALNEQFVWRLENDALAKLETVTGASAPIIALSEGFTKVIVESADKRLSASREIQISKANFLLNPVYIDFGSLAVGKPFNAIVNFRNHQVANLLDYKDKETGIDFEIINDFEGQNESGVINNLLGLPSQVSADAFYGSNNNSEAVIKLTKLNRNKYYNFSFYGSRRDVNDNRETSYTVTGRHKPVTVYQNASNNASVISVVKDIRPNENGEVTISITYGPNNNNASKFFYLNALMIEPAN